MVQTRSQTAIAQGKVVAHKVAQDEDEMEVKVWGLRNEMVGMKNVNMQKREKIMTVLGELEEIDESVMVEVIMDLLKFQWKFVLKDLSTLDAFKNEFDHAYEHINCECIPEWLQVQISQFKQDFENLMANFMCEKFKNITVKNDCGEGLISILPIDLLPKTKDEYVRMIWYTLDKIKETKGSNELIFWSLQTIEHSANFVIDLGEIENLGRFKETVIIKIKEFIDDPQLNETQKARLGFLLTELSDVQLTTEEINMLRNS